MFILPGKYYSFCVTLPTRKHCQACAETFFNMLSPREMEKSNSTIQNLVRICLALLIGLAYSIIVFKSFCNPCYISVLISNVVRMFSLLSFSVAHVWARRGGRTRLGNCIQKSPSDQCRSNQRKCVSAPGPRVPTTHHSNLKESRPKRVRQWMN